MENHSGKVYRVRRKKDRQLEPCATPAFQGFGKKEGISRRLPETEYEYQISRELCSKSKGRGFKKEMIQGNQAKEVQIQISGLAIKKLLAQGESSSGSQCHFRVIRAFLGLGISFFPDGRRWQESYPAFKKVQSWHLMLLQILNYVFNWIRNTNTA